VKNDPPSPFAAPHAEIESAGLAFLAEFFEIATRHRPDDIDVLAELGHVYTRLGRLQEGLEIDLRLVGLVPDNPTAHYNLACSLALLGRRAPALESLERAVELGYADPEYLLEDDDLKSLREEPRFAELVSRLERSQKKEAR